MTKFTSTLILAAVMSISSIGQDPASSRTPQSDNVISNEYTYVYQAPPRTTIDWFLLKPEHELILQKDRYRYNRYVEQWPTDDFNTSKKAADAFINSSDFNNYRWFSPQYEGPALSPGNSDWYFRMMTGMILQEMMRRRGGSSEEAQIYLSKLHNTQSEFLPKDLPAPFRGFYEDRDNRYARLNFVMKYIMALAVSYHEARFQHFYHAPLSPTEPGSARCENEEHDPLSFSGHLPRIREIEAQIKSRSSDYDEKSIAFLETSGALRDHNGKIDKLQSQIERVQAAILSSQKEVDTGVGRAARQARQKRDELQDQYDSTTREITEHRALIESDLKSIAKLNADLESLDKEIAQKIEKRKSLTVELDALDKELTPIKEQVVSRLGLKHAEPNSPDLTQGLETIRRLNTEIAEKIDQVAEIDLRLQSARAARSQSVVDIENQENRLATHRANLANLYVKQEADFTNLVAAKENLAKTDQTLALTEAPISARRRLLDGLNVQMKSMNDEKLKIEQSQRKAQAELTDSDAKFSEITKLKSEITSIREKVRDYVHPDEMGWFLEEDCSRRNGSTDWGLFVSRRKRITKGPYAEAESDGPKGSGDWGAMQLNYQYNNQLIRDGILLNLPNYLTYTLDRLGRNLDEMIAQWNVSGTRYYCSGLGSGGESALPINLIGAVYAVWNGGPTGGRCRTVEQNHEHDIRFKEGLLALIRFKDSELDSLLPKVGVYDESFLIEREAIQRLAQEMALLTNNDNDLTKEELASSDLRTQRLITAMIKVLAFDYQGYIRRSMDKERFGLSFMQKQTAKTESPTVRADVDEIINEQTKSIEVGSVIVNRNLYLERYKSKDSEQSDSLVALGDQLEVIEPLEKDRVKVQSLTNKDEFFVAASHLSNNIPMLESGRAGADLSKCPLLKKVKTNYGDLSRKVTPYELEANGDVAPFGADIGANTKDGAIYLACDERATNGTAINLDIVKKNSDHPMSNYISVNLIEVMEVKDVSGKMVHYPAESNAGWVVVWTNRNDLPRVELIDGDVRSDLWRTDENK